MSEVKIYIHILAHLPHYYPLYMAAQELSATQKLPVRVKLHENVTSIALFERAAQEHRQFPKAIHLVVSGEYEEAYGIEGRSYSPDGQSPAEEESPRTIVDDFVCASLLLERTPLWILTVPGQEKKARTFLRAPDTYPDARVHLPPVGLTLTNEILQELPNLAALKLPSGQWNGSRVRLASFEFLPAEVIASELNSEDSVAYFSIYPSNPKDSETLKPVIDRLPSSSYGFSALWALKEQVTDRDRLDSLVKFMAAVEFFIRELSKCDNEILTAPFESIRKGVEPLLQLYPPGEFEGTILEGKSFSNRSWHGSIDWMLRIFISERIWAYNHALQFRQRVTGKEAVGPESIVRRLRSYLAGFEFVNFNPRCLTEHLLRTQLDIFHNRIQNHVKILIAEKDALDRVSYAVSRLMTLTTGASDTLEKGTEDALSRIIAFYLNALFTGDFHRPDEFTAHYQDEKALAHCLGDPLDNEDVRKEVERHLRSLAVLTGSDAPWYRNSNLFQERFPLLLQFLEEGLNGNVTGAIDLLNADVKLPGREVPLLVAEMKALSRNWIPGSWLIGLGKWNSRLCTDPSTFVENGLRLRGGARHPEFPAFDRTLSAHSYKAMPMTYFGPIAALAELRAELEAAGEEKKGYQDGFWKPSSDDLFIELRFKAEQGDFADLQPLVYMEKPGKRIGRTSGRLRVLHGMGWNLTFPNAEERKVRLSFPKGGIRFV